MKKLALILCLVICGLTGQTQQCFAQAGCLTLWKNVYPHYPNRDSVMIDTCGGLRQMFAKRMFRIEFDYYAILPTTVATHDTILEFSWNAIDSSFPAIRSAFHYLDTHWGGLHLLKPHAQISDTADITRRVFGLTFDNYVPVDSIVAYLSTVSQFTIQFVSKPGVIAGVPGDLGMHPGSRVGQIYQDGDDTFWDPGWHARSWQWNLFSLRLPMAWEITRGKPTVFVGDHDYFGTTLSSHPDMGNYKTLSKTDPLTADDVSGEHGIECMSQAIAAGDNGYPMVGTCPACSGFGLNSNMTQAHEVDVDASSHIGFHGVQVFYRTTDAGHENDATLIGHGTVVLSAAGNSLVPEAEQFFQPQIVDGIDYLYPGIPGYGSSVIVQGSTPAQDVTTIYVGPTTDGYKCVIPDGHTKYFGAEQVLPGWNLSLGQDKFNSSSSSAIRAYHKNQAYMDLVAPAAGLLGAQDGESSTVPNRHKYDVDMSGTSYATPMVAGIVGLMRSVSEFLNVSLGTDGRPVHGSDVQIAASNILTFTAQKIYDFNNFDLADAGASRQFATGYPAYYAGFGIVNDFYLHFEDPAYPGNFDPAYAGQPWQYGYNTSSAFTSNDPQGLQRSWAQRAGFGEADAYRAVANCIPTIGSYEYSASGTLDFTSIPTINESGVYLMHFGAWKDATHKVLTAGGNIIPNQSPAWPHLNQGKTLINSSGGSATTLTVPAGCTLAVDGLLMQTDGTLHSNALTTSGTGKVLLTGYLQDVKVSGTTMCGDLVIYSADIHDRSQISVGSGQTSEVYGIVRLQNNGEYNVTGGDLVLQPGGEIHMDGNKDLEIVSGTATMDGGSKIVSASHQIIIDNGAHLVVKGGTTDYILATLHVKSGGTVEITNGTELSLDHFIIDPSGTMTCDAGSTLRLNKSPFNYCYGNLSFNGTSTSRCTLTGAVSCGAVIQTSGIQVQGSTASAPEVFKTRIQMFYTDDHSVEIIAKDARKSNFINDNFSSNSSYNHSISQMLNVYNTSLVAAKPYYEVSRLTVQNCKFFDEQGEIATTYHIADGLNVNNIQVLQVNSSYFYNTRTGCIVSNCPNANYSANIMGLDPLGAVAPLIGGIYEQSSAARYCSNTVSHCYVGGITGISDLKGTMYDNVFAFDTSWSLATQVGGQYDLRNNSFSNYRHWIPWVASTAGYAVWSAGKGNLINMRDVGTVSPLLFGRNSFVGASALDATDLARGTSLYGPHNGDLSVKCGLNCFSNTSLCRIKSLDFAYALPIDYNNWMVFAGCNVAGAGVNLLTCASVSTGCNSMIDAGPPCTVNGIIPSDPYPSTTAWFTTDSSSSTLKYAFASSSAMFLSDTNTVDNRRIKSQDELWAATLIDSEEVYLPKVLIDCDTVLNRAWTPGELKSATLMLKGHIEEMLGDRGAAMTSYNLVLSGYHQYQDSVSAFWGVLRTGIPDTATSFADTLRSAYVLKVYADLMGMEDTGSVAAPKVATQGEYHPSQFTLAVHPNPAAGSTVIELNGLSPNVGYNVEVLDLTGRLVRSLNNGSPTREGALKLSFDGSNIAPGTYFIRASNGDVVRTVRLVWLK
jgi:hypothetical protein